MIRYLLLIVVLLVSLFVPLTPARAADPPPPEAPLPGEGPWVVRAEYTDRAMVDELAAWLEPWEVHHDAGYLVAEVSYADYVRMVEAGFTVQVDAKQTARLHQPFEWLPGQINGIPGYLCYRTVEETYQAAQDIVAAHPNLATWTDIGDSWEKQEPGGAPGYDLMVLRLTNASISGPKPKLFMMTSVHAREYTPAELGARFAEYLVDNYGADADVTWLLDYHEIHLLLQANPDGRKKAETGLYWRKNTNENYCGATSNSRGADLNRNFAFQWGCCGGSSGYGCDDTYRGPSPASEPETQAVQDYVRSQFPDQREDDLSSPAPLDATGVFLDIHSYSELILWPWGFTATEAPNGPQLQTLGRKFAYFNGYEPDSASDLYITDGTTDGLAYGELGLAAYTFELGTSFFQDCGTFEGTILPDNLPALLYAAKVARTPYMTPAGPDALGVAVTMPGVVPGEAVTLTALLDDARYYDTVETEPSQAIAAAEYTVDVPPWEAGATSHAMMAQDGGFDETSEAVQAVLDTTGWSIGRHIIYVRGQDADGNWGAVSAVFVHVLDPATAPLITGRVRDACANGPLQATVAAGNFQTTADPATGLYEMHVISGTYNLVVSAPGYVTETLPGIVARDEHVIQQDAHLYPAVTKSIFSDDVESGNMGWEAEGNWAITTEDAHSPTHAWTDSPSGNYGNNQAVALTSPRLDLSKYSDMALSFWHTYAIEEDYDYGRVQVSSDDGASWTNLNSYTGSSSWEEVTLAASALDGAGQAHIRFLLNTDVYVVDDGWYIDDIALTGARGVCKSPIGPSAAFTTNTVVSVGDPVIFTNITTGTVPLTYAWAFGDGGTSTLEEPTHAYVQAGSYTVHLTATNAYGTDVTTATVAVRDVFVWTGAAGTDWHAAANWSAAAIPGAADNVVIPSHPSGGRWPVITGSATCRQLTLEPGAVLIVDAGATLNVETELINQGRLIQRASVDGSEPVDFLRVDTLAGNPRYHGVIIDAVDDMGTVTVTVRGGQGCGAAGTLPDTVQRCYDITPQITQTATITFYYHTDEANGNRKPTVYHYAGGGQWEALTMIPREVDVAPWRLVVAVVEAYSPFALKDDEPAIIGVHEMRGGGGAGVSLAAGCVLGLALVLHVRRRRRG